MLILPIRLNTSIEITEEAGEALPGKLMKEEIIKNMRGIHELLKQEAKKLLMPKPRARKIQIQKAGQKARLQKKLHK